jgi:outer membrane protein assembly factor BamB
LAALADVGRFGIEYRDRQAFQTGLMRRYWEVASYSEDAFDEIWRQWQTVPINSLYIDTPSFEPLVRKELFKRIYTRPSAETQAFVQRAKFYHLDEQVPLIRWADYISRRESPNRGPKESNAAIRDGWPHPLIEEVSKEAYNVTSDLRSVLESDAIEDAARMISRLDLGQIQGLTTAVDDRALFVSASNSIKAALLRQPQLEQLLAEKYGKLARLRFEEATAAGNAAAMENLALQFHATEAGAEAHKWLGERALAEGRFELAVAEFKRASEHGSATILREMEPLQRLAAAMLGREAGSAVEREVAFGTTRFTPAEFENLVEEMRNRGQQVGIVAGTVTAGEPATAAIPPTGLQAERRGAFDGPSGDRHTEEGARHVNHYKLPWVDRQLAVAVEQDTAYVSNRFQVAAYDLTNGQRKWQSQPPPGLKVKRAQEAALVTARPLVFAKRIIVRQMYGDGFLLTCLNKDDGKLVWMLPFKEPEHLLSDPFWLYGSLVAITGWRETTDYVLRWTVFDAETGAIEQQKDILRLKQSWLRRPSLEFALLDDGVVVQGAGSVFQLDAAGNTRWLRKFVWSPEEEDPRAVVQSFQKPIVDNGKLYVTQPGVRCVTCLDATTGWQRWTRVLPELCGILGLVDSRLIVQQENELLALDAADGQIVWRQRLGETHPAWICNQDWLISVEREKLDPAKETRTNRVVWRETKTGAVAGSARLTGFDDDDPRFGLLLAQREKLWTFAGKSQSDPNRTLVELRPQGEIERSLTERTPIWVKGLDPKLNPSKKPFPQFMLLQGLPGDKAGPLSDMHGEKDVFGARSWFDKPVAWLYTGVLPTDTNRLKLKIGVDDGVAWKLRVTVNGKRLIDEEFKPQKDRWVERELPLAEFRDQDVVLVVAAYATDGVERVIYFKRLQVE